jgi:hypothetical protein
MTSYSRQKKKIIIIKIRQQIFGEKKMKGKYRGNWSWGWGWCRFFQARQALSDIRRTKQYK